MTGTHLWDSRVQPVQPRVEKLLSLYLYRETSCNLSLFHDDLYALDDGAHEAHRRHPETVQWSVSIIGHCDRCRGLPLAAYVPHSFMLLAALTQVGPGTGIICDSRTWRNTQNSWRYPVRYIHFTIVGRMADSAADSPAKSTSRVTQRYPLLYTTTRMGVIMAAGAEADSSSIVAQAEDDGWIKAELCVAPVLRHYPLTALHRFKLRLRPRQMQLKHERDAPQSAAPRKVPRACLRRLPQLLVQLHSFIYIRHTCKRRCSVERRGIRHPIRAKPSKRVGRPTANAQCARPQCTAGLVPDSDEGRARIRFVTEGEASLHACVLSGLAGDVLSVRRRFRIHYIHLKLWQNPSKHGFLIADAGGGTLDISSYAIKGTSPLSMEEIAPPDCIFAGSVFVSRRAREFLEGLFVLCSLAVSKI